jgi:hypothetical protein
VWATAIIWVGSYFRDVLVAFAGKTTQAAVSFQFITQIGASRGFAYFLAALGGGYGLAERQLRQSNIRRMRGQTSELEPRMDPNRTSSGLTLEGKTRRGDS